MYMFMYFSFSSGTFPQVHAGGWTLPLSGMSEGVLEWGGRGQLAHAQLVRGRVYEALVRLLAYSGNIHEADLISF